MSCDLREFIICHAETELDFSVTLWHEWLSEILRNKNTKAEKYFQGSRKFALNETS